MGDRQDETLRERIHQGEGELIVVEGAVDRVIGEVLQGVVHPAHVPLQGEAQAAVPGRCGDTGPGGGFLGDGQCTRVHTLHGGVHLLDELDGLQVLAATVDVGLPLAVCTGVVEVEHGGHGIHTQSIDVEFLQPVQGIGDEEVTDLIATEVEDVGAPVLLLTAAPVWVLVEGLTVEPRQCPVILGEVGGHPVDDHADATGVEGVDELAQLIR